MSVFNHIHYTLALSYDKHLISGARYRRIKQVSGHKHWRTAKQGKNNYRELAALALVDGNTVRKRKFFQLLLAV